MKKDIYVDDEFVKIIEHKKFLFIKEYENEINVPVHLIKLVQKSYTDEGGTAAVAIFLETENEFFISADEVDDIEKVFNDLLDLKIRTNKYRVEVYNIRTKETIDK